MHTYDFSNHQNRHLRLEDLSPEYYAMIRQTTRSDPYYPAWHIAPPCGLLNDPNGLCEIHGVHHIFHQWFPAGPVHGLKYWRHITTRDFLHYQDEGVAMAPDQPCDRFGCYTGMALREDDGGARLYYTGLCTRDQEPCTCTAWFDGQTVTDRRKLFGRDPAVTTLNYRDPCVWKNGSGYHMLVGGENLQHKGVLLLYNGSAPDRFVPCGTLDLGGQDFGYMLECPNYYEEDGTGVLFFSPMGITGANKYDYKNVFSVVYCVGLPLDTDRGRFTGQNIYELDKGFDFYAPQSYRDERGRRILFGWLGNSKNPYPTDRNHWAHMLTMPRLLQVKGDRLLQQPLPELEALRGPAGTLPDALSLDSCCLEVEAEAGETFSFVLQNGQGESLRFYGTAEEYILDRSGMSEPLATNFGTVRYARRLHPQGKIRIFVDHSCIEIFCDEGATVFTARFFLRGDLTLHSKGLQGTVYPLKKALWTKAEA